MLGPSAPAWAAPVLQAELRAREDLKHSAPAEDPRVVREVREVMLAAAGAAVEVLVLASTSGSLELTLI